MTTQEWTTEVQKNSSTAWKTVHIKQGNDTIAIVDDLICGERDALELANDIAFLHNMAVRIDKKVNNGGGI